MKNVMIPGFPEGLTVTGDALRLKQQGDEPHAPSFESLHLSDEWRVFADDREVPVYATPVTRGGPHSFAKFRYGGNEKVTVRLVRSTAVSSAVLEPASMHLVPRIDGSTVTFELDHPAHVTCLVNGDIEQPVTVDMLPVRQENCRGTEGKHFSAGLHYIDYMDLENGDVLYAGDGAVIIAKPHPETEKALNEHDWAGKRNFRTCILANEKKDIRICGGGIIDFSLLDWHERNCLVLRGCEGVHVEDITLVNAPSWNLNIIGCDHVQVDNVSVYGYRENSDGIDIVSSTDVWVHDCFLRTGDDAVVVKAMVKPPRTGGKDIRCERCTVWNDKVRCFGIAAESVNDISDVYFGDCDVIRSYADWTLELGTLVVYICDSALVEHVVFENIRIEHEKHLGAHVMITKDFWSKTKEAGNIRNVVFKDISLPEGVRCRAAGYDEEHTVSGVRFINLVRGGKKEETLADAGIEVCGYADHVTIE